MIKIKILYNGKVYSDTSQMGDYPSGEPVTNGIRRTTLTGTITVDGGKSAILAFTPNVPADEVILSITPICTNAQVLTSVHNVTNTQVNVNVANLTTGTLTLEVQLIVESLVENSLQYFIPTVKRESLTFTDIFETGTIIKWGNVATIKLDRFISGYTTTGSTLSIGNVPDDCKAAYSQSGLILLRLGSKNTHAYFGVNTSGGMSVNIPIGVELNNEMTYGKFDYITS